MYTCFFLNNDQTTGEWRLRGKSFTTIIDKESHLSAHDPQEPTVYQSPRAADDTIQLDGTVLHGTGRYCMSNYKLMNERPSGKLPSWGFRRTQREKISTHTTSAIRVTPSAGK